MTANQGPYLERVDDPVGEEVGQPFQTNLAEHRWILAHDVLREHGVGEARGRHVGWVVDALRARGRAGPVARVVDALDDDLPVGFSFGSAGTSSSS